MLLNDSFKNLLEIQSIDNHIKNHMDKIKEHKNRVKHIDTQLNNSALQLTENEEDLSIVSKEFFKHEQELNKLETTLEQNKKKLKLAQNEQQLTAAEKELESLSNQHQICEEHVLDLMEKKENLDSEIKRLKDFISGATDSREGISQQTAKDIENEKHEINNYNKRIESLFSECLPQVKSTFEALNNKYRFKFPISYIENGKCYRCSFAVNGNDQNEVEKSSKIIACINCGRILVSHSIVT